jgi:hypothetical protein
MLFALQQRAELCWELSKRYREGMATLFVLKFNDPYGADRVLLALQGLQGQEKKLREAFAQE